MNTEAAATGSRPDQWQADAHGARCKCEGNMALACGSATVDAVLALLSMQHRRL